MLWIPDKPDEEQVKEVILKILSGIFDFDITDRISVRSDTSQFRIMEDESVWLQAKRRAPHYYELYWDGVWINDFDESMDYKAVRLMFLKGFKEKFENGEVTINTRQELTNEIVEDAAQKAINEMKVESEEDAIFKETLQEVKNEKSKRKVKKLSDI